MDPLKTYDYLVLARRRMFDWIRVLGDEDYAREFPYGHKSLKQTLTHILTSEWYYVERIRRNDVPPYDQWTIRDESPLPFVDLEPAWNEQAARTRSALEAVEDWDVEFEYPVTDDDGRPMIVTVSAGEIFTQLVLHEVHHRSQAMSMLRQIGVAVEDLDYNALMYRRREASPA